VSTLVLRVARPAAGSYSSSDDAWGDGQGRQYPSRRYPSAAELARWLRRGCGPHAVVTRTI
jgi:hypothetical protein